MDTKQQKESSIYWWPEAGKLIFLKEEATPEFWDRQWQRDDWKTAITRSRKSRFWAGILKKYLPDKNSRVLEGGCGYGHIVDAMDHWGYKATGVDFAPETIAKIKEVMPHIDVRCGDVKDLNFIADEYFDGYWSLGVIEHFWEGYDDILKEMNRVLKPGGYVFLSFPCISPLDKIRAFFSAIDKFSGTEMPANFYQFALELKSVKRDFEVLGYKLLDKQRKVGLLGLSRYFTWARRLNDYLVAASGKSRLAKYFMFGLNYILAPFCGHSVLLVFRKS